jgi:5-oxoprolinase (ATP-hydrolysing) subunit C
MGLIIIDAGLSTTVQDAGRPGYRGWGVGPGGAFDRGSADLANALLGNPAICAVLELTLTGGVYEADCPLALALAGAPMEAILIGPDGIERPLQIPSSVSLDAGHRLILGRTREGARTYLAVRGGWQTRLRLGSRSSEERIRAGDVLPAEPGAIPTRRPARPTWKSPTADPIRIIEGPDGRSASAFDEAFRADRRFRVGSRSDRMGLRLEGDPLAVASAPERLSTPVAPGAIQTAGGQLIILGIACGTMGGYPHVAHVISADLDRLGQLKPGDLITFRPVTLEDARNADRQSRQARKTFLDRVSTAAQDGF